MLPDNQSLKNLVRFNMLVLFLIGIVACNPVIETNNQNETQTLSENGTDISQGQIQGRNTVNFECSKNHFIKWMKSSYKNHYGVRQWDFGCEEQPFNYDTKKCKWTGSLADSPGGLGGRPPPPHTRIKSVY